MGASVYRFGGNLPAVAVLHAVLPRVPPPTRSFLDSCLLASLPPMYVSSTSTGPANFSVSVPRLADAVRHVPGGLLSDTQVTVQLHAGHAFEAGAVQVEPNGPLGEGRLESWRMVPVLTVKSNWQALQ